MARNKYDVDEVVEQKFDIKQLKRLVDYIRPYKGKMFFVLVLMLSSSGLGMFLPKFLQIEMDKYTRQRYKIHCDAHCTCRSYRSLFGNKYESKDRCNN